MVMFMRYNDLSSLITALEYGTKLHISVVFLKHYGNRKMVRPFPQKVHLCPVCDYAKEKDFTGCFRCRNTVLKLLLKRKTSFGGYCAKGVYEYCRPVLRSGEVAAVVFVGNILTDDPAQLEKLSQHIRKPLLKTMQTDFTQSDCHRIADLVESYIHYLMDRYGETAQKPYDVLIENIKNYIEENLLHEFSMADLAAVFNYNEKYLGRIFKERTGITIKEYCNLSKIGEAKLLLANTTLSITAIATQVGYNNVTYFDRLFKRITGLSPQEYRNEVS